MFQATTTERPGSVLAFLKIQCCNQNMETCVFQCFVFSSVLCRLICRFYRIMSAVLLRAAKITVREMNFILYRPEKSVTKFPGCANTKQTSPLIFCSSQKQGAQRACFFHHISFRRVCAVMCATLSCRCTKRHPR